MNCFRIRFILYKLVPGIAFSLMFVAGGLGQDRETNVKAVAKDIIRSPLLKHGTWGCSVRDCETDTILFEQNGERSLAPASNLKLLTTAAALANLGGDLRFTTRIVATGSIQNGILKGDLCIIGGGDPTLGTTLIPNHPSWRKVLKQIVDLIQKASISSISGNLVVDVSYFDGVPLPDGWPWVDIGNYYGAGVYALCFHDNLYTLYLKPGKIVGAPAAILGTDPDQLELLFENRMATGPVGSGDQGYIYGGPWGKVRQLRGTIPAGVRRFGIKGSMVDPPRTFARLLQRELKNRGISFQGDIKISTLPVKWEKEIGVLQSPPLRKIIYWLNKKSINLYAEVLLKQLGKVVAGEGSFAAGLSVVEAFLQEMKISIEGARLLDGSGLSPQNRITPNLLSLLLAKMANSSFFDDFYNSFPVAGVDADPGNLGYFCRRAPAAGNVRAKTGLINGVRAHSGYVRTRSGRLLAFSLISNGHLGSTSAIDRLHQRFLIALAEL